MVEQTEAAYDAPVGPVVDRFSWAAVARRAFDLAGAVVLLLVLLPVLIAIAVAVSLDSKGSPIFRQRRFGRGMRPFTVNKFRTMRAEADSGPHRDYVRELIVRGNQAAREQDDVRMFKLVTDDRVTRVGRFLRRWSLDELPQLWNVVRGEMSLVGPRPVIEYEVEHYPSWYFRRFDVKPGLTGLWQVSGRNERTYEEMVQFDVDYVRRQSLRLDFVILAKTAWVVLRRRGVA